MMRTRVLCMIIINIVITSVVSVFIPAASSGAPCQPGAPYDCLNGGTCIRGLCDCTTGFSGENCEIAMSTNVPITSSALTVTATPPEYHTVIQNGTQYYLFNQQYEIFETAVQACARFGARIVSNVYEPDVRTALGKLFHTVNSTFDVSVSAHEMHYWAISGRYPKPINRNWNVSCPVISQAYVVGEMMCDDEMKFICSRPTRGSCFPEMAKTLCPTKLSICEQRIDRFHCICEAGFHNISGSCMDKNECNPRMVCKDINSTCTNTVGSYVCGCQDGMQGDGINLCGYVVTVIQNITMASIPHHALKQPLSMSISSNEAFKIELQQKLMHIYSQISESIKHIYVKTIRNDSTTIMLTYDVYSKYKRISPTSLREFYLEALDRSATWWFEDNLPEIAPVACTPSMLGLGYKRFAFSSSKPGVRAPSLQKCRDGRSLATVECRTKINSDFTITAYYDFRTLVHIACDVSTAMINNEITNVTNFAKVEKNMRELDSLTSDVENTNETVFREAAITMKNFADIVMDGNLMISESTMSSMLSVANNINHADRHYKASDLSTGLQLSNKERLDVATSLEKCSTHVTLDPGTTAYFNSDFVELQVTNAVQNATNPSDKWPHGIQFMGEMSPIGAAEPPCRAQKEGVRSFIPMEAIDKANAMKQKSSKYLNNLAVSFMYFADSQFFSTGDNVYHVEQVLSARISNVKIHDLNNPVWFQMPPANKPATDKRNIRFYQCAYLNEDDGQWMPDGCVTIPGAEPPNCTCDHMTNFAVLVQTHNILQEYSLEIFGKIGCLISVVCLFLMILIHLYFPTLRSSQVIQIHSHLGLCLMIAYALLLTSAERPRAYGSCVAVAGFIHFFLLGAWGWMVVECFTMHKKLVSVFSQTGSHYVLKASLIVYSISAIVVSLTLVVAVGWYDNSAFEGWVSVGSHDIPSSYISDRFCWLHGFTLIFGFLVPVGIAFLLNLLGFILILRAITWGRKRVGATMQNKKTDLSSYLIRAVTISVLLGISWIFAIPLTLSDDVHVNFVFGWLFSITNALQGLFIFLLFCVRREDVRKLWWNAVVSTLCRRKKKEKPGLSLGSMGLSSRMSTTATPLSHTTVNFSAQNNEVQQSVVEETGENHKNGGNNGLDDVPSVQLIGPTSSFHPAGQVSES